MTRHSKPRLPLPAAMLCKAWFGIAAVTLVAAAAAIVWIDHPLAIHFLNGFQRFETAREMFDSPEIVGAELVLLIILFLARAIGANAVSVGNALAVAICASLISFLVNDHLLKPLFGRACPIDQLLYHRPDFRLLAGNKHDCFPSGHIVLASTFAFTLVRIFPKLWLACAAFLLLGAVLLVTADAHFVADIIAGLFVGTTFGVAAGEFLLRHLARRYSTR